MKIVPKSDVHGRILVGAVEDGPMGRFAVELEDRRLGVVARFYADTLVAALWPSASQHDMPCLS
uniref:hypothetical protein n=1 Tax=Rhodothermus marinus TaxID=29549 RepID=UPI0018665B6C|nr:hypothetical protein [Rhodothermus marinus]